MIIIIMTAGRVSLRAALTIQRTENTAGPVLLPLHVRYMMMNKFSLFAPVLRALTHWSD